LTSLTDAVLIGHRIVGAAIFKDYILAPVNMNFSINMLTFIHGAGWDGCGMAIKTVATGNGIHVTVVAGETSKEMTVMRVGFVGVRSSISIHRHG
jgi:hypothetical protein